MARVGEFRLGKSHRFIRPVGNPGDLISGLGQDGFHVDGGEKVVFHDEESARARGKFCLLDDPPSQASRHGWPPTTRGRQSIRRRAYASATSVRSAAIEKLHAAARTVHALHFESPSELAGEPAHQTQS